MNSVTSGVGGGVGIGAQQRRGKVVVNPTPGTVLVVEDNTSNMNTMTTTTTMMMTQTTTATTTELATSTIIPTGTPTIASSSTNGNSSVNTSTILTETGGNYDSTSMYNNNSPMILQPIQYPSSTTMTSKNGANGTNLTIDNGSVSNSISTSTSTGTGTAIITKVATVKRNWVGTGPFDHHWLNVDCCGLFCALLTYFLHWYGMYVVCFVIIPPWMSYNDTNSTLASSTSSNNSTSSTAGTPVTSNTTDYHRSLSILGFLNCLFFTTFTILAVVAHFKAMTTDPGAVPPDAKPLVIPTEDDTNNNETTGLLSPDNDNTIPSGPKINNNTTNNNKTIRVCRKCQTFKPPRAHHCSICKRCIIKMDHHCPWVNNCVGIGNHKYFLLFVFYTCVTCLYSLAIIIFRFSTCVNSYHHHKKFHYRHVNAHTANEAAIEAMELSSGRSHCLDHPTQLLHILGLLVESLLFGMFTSCMIFDQADVIRTNVSHIDRFKGGNDKIAGALSGVAEVFGLTIPKSTRNSSTISNNNKYMKRMSRYSIFAIARGNNSNNRKKIIDGNDSDDYANTYDTNNDSTTIDSSSIHDCSERSNISIGKGRKITSKKQQQQQHHSVSFRLDWLSPFAQAVFPPSVRDEMMGFCRPCLPRRPNSFYDDNNNKSNNRSNSPTFGNGVDFELGTITSSTGTAATIINSPSRNHRTIRSVAEIL